MKKKLISMLIVMILLLSYSNCIFAAVTYTRTGGTALNTIAEQITNDIYIDGDYSAVSNSVTLSDVSIYKYNTTTAQTKSDTEIEYTGNEDRYYLRSEKETVGENEYDYLYYSLKFPSGEQTAENVATFIYKDGITYKGQNYNVKFNIKKIEKAGDGEAVIAVRLGRRTAQTSNMTDESTYTDKVVIPYIHVFGSDSKIVEIETEYYMLDNSGNEVPISGLLAISDIDLNQGFFIDNYTAENGNVFMNQNNTILEYKTLNNGTYIYASNDEETSQNNAYTLFTNRSNMKVTYTWDSKTAGSGLRFVSDVINRYKKITTQVTGGTITDSITNIKDGENKTITYAPGENKYLKSVTVDGTAIDITQNPESYTFSNITADHNIVVVYEDKLTVTHDPKGGAPTPEVQYVLPNETATTVTEPTREGYTFERWQKTGENTAYDYTTPVVENTTLEAVWTPITYTITYITNGGTNDPTNPENYTIEDVIDFKNPTRDGYDFLGWYEDEALTTTKAGISHETGNKTVYAKWEAKQGATYKVEHYKETTNGNYELVVTDELTATPDTSVTAVAKEYTGFKENTTHENRIPSGTVASDGSLVLKLYYDKIDYTVTFDTKGGSKNPDNQTVKYNDKATKPTDPTKKGYTFQYWYYINDEGKEVQYNFGDPVTKNIDLFAKWKEVKTVIPTVTPSDTPNSLPKTGEKEEVRKNILMIGISLIIITIAGVTFKLKYNNLKGIK